jgi:hypothetical protein
VRRQIVQRGQPPARKTLHALARALRSYQRARAQQRAAHHVKCSGQGKRRPQRQRAASNQHCKRVVALATLSNPLDSEVGEKRVCKAWLSH